MNLFFGSFRKADADDPETFTAGCTRLFTAYEPDTVRYVVDPITGLPGKSTWLPSLSEVKKALDARAHEIAMRREREQQAERQLAERKKWLEGKDHRPTYDELKSRHGGNWGMKAIDQESETVKARRKEQLTAANQRAFEAECVSAGMSPDSQISPSLARLLRPEAFE